MGEPTKGTRKQDDPRGHSAPAQAGSVHEGRSGDTPNQVDLESIREQARTAARAALSVKADDVKNLHTIELNRIEQQQMITSIWAACSLTTPC